MNILRVFMIILFVIKTKTFSSAFAFDDYDFDDDLDYLLENSLTDNTHVETEIDASFLDSSSQINCSNAENVKIIQSNSNELYVLSKTELFRVSVKTDDQHELEFLGDLGGIKDFRKIHGFRTIKWNEILIVVVALDDFYTIYMRPLGENVESATMVPIQRIGPVDGSSKRIVLVQNESDLFCLVGIAHTELLGKIVLYKWRHSHFTIVEERSLFVMDDILLFQNPDEILFLIIKYGDDHRKTTIEAFNLDETQQLARLQMLYFESSHIKPFAFSGHFYFISCIKTDDCFIYRYDPQDKIFKRFQKLADNIKYDEITQFAYRDNFIAVQQLQNNVQLYTNSRLNRVASELEDLLSFVPTNMFLTHEPNRQQEFLVLVHLQEPNLQIRFYGISSKEKLGNPQPILDDTEQTPEKIIEQHLDQLKDLLMGRIDNAVTVKSEISKTIQLDKDLNITNLVVVKLPGSLHLDKVELHNATVLPKLEISADQLMKSVVTLNIRRAELFGEMQNRLFVNESNVIEGDLRVLGNVMTHSSTINKIFTENRPDMVMLKQPRETDLKDVPQNLRVQTLVAKRLVVPAGAKEFQNLIRQSTKTRLEGNVTFGQLFADSLDIKNSMINNLSLESAVRRQQPPTVILGTKQILQIRSKNLTVALVNDFNFTKILLAATKNFKQLVESSNHLRLTVGNFSAAAITVERINGLEWADFYKTLFLKGRDRQINGSLTLAQNATIKSLVTTLINEIPTASLMTLTTDQEINSDIFIQKFLTSNMSISGLLNDAIHFKDDIVEIGRENFIETPVEFQRIEVEKSLEITEEEPAEHLARHIIGTRIDDLSQLYTGRVVIEGTLTLQHLQCSEIVNRTKISVDNQQFNMRIPEEFWMKSINQNLGNVSFSKPAKAIHLLANNLNHHPVGQYVFVVPYPNERADSNYVSMIIDNAKVDGSVLVDSEYVTPIAQINSAAVRRGQKSSIVGKIRFTDELVIDHLTTDSLDKQSVGEFVLRNQTDIEFTGPKAFAELHINGPIVVDSEDADSHPKVLLKILNSLNVTTFFQDSIMIDHEQQEILIPHAIFETINCGAASFKTLNDLKFEELLIQLESVGGGKQVVRTLNVTSGDVYFSNALTVDTINGLNIQDYLDLVVLTTKSNAQIGGVKRFTEGLTVTDSVQVATKISNVPIDEWLRHSLLKSTPQTIRGEWKFKNIQSDQVTARELDGVQIKALIDGGLEQKIDIYSDVYVRKLKVDGSLLGAAKVDFKALADRMTLPAGINWQKLIVEGDVTLPVETNTKLDTLLTKSVTKTGPPQTISGKLTFKTAPNLEHVLVKAPNAIYGVDILAIYADGLKRNSHYPQIVLCAKNFVNGLVINESMQTLEYIRIPIVNDVDVLKLNSSIVRLAHDHVIDSEKTFAVPPRIEYLYVTNKNKINNVSVDDLVFLRNKKPLPTTTFHNLSVVANVDIVAVNNFSMEHLLLNRVRLFSSMLEPSDALLPLYMQEQHQQDIGGHLTFENLIIEGDETRISSINDVRIDDIVFQYAEYLQEVHGSKEVKGKLTLIGPSAIEVLNGFELSQLYQQSISTIAPKIYLKSLELHEKLVLEKGMIVGQQINEKPIGNVLQYTPPTNLMTFVPIIPAVMQLIDHCEALAAVPHTKHLLYLDYDTSLEIVQQDSEEVDAANVKRSIQADEDQTSLRCKPMEKSDSVQISTNNRIYVSHQNEDIKQFRRVDKVYGQMLNVTIENDCKDIVPANESVKSYLQLQWRTNQNTVDYHFQNFTFPHRVKDIRQLEPFDVDLQLLIVLFQATASSNTSIQILGLDSTISVIEWQLLQKIRIVGDDAMIEVVATKSYELLLVSVLNEDGGGGVIYIYCFDPYTELFIEIQRIPGHYDLLAYAYVPTPSYDNYMLVLGQRNNRLLQIYKIDETNALSSIPQYIMFQTINFDATITKISTFQIEDTHLAVLLDTGNFFLYKYNFVEGWIRIVNGYFPDIKTIVPFRWSGHNYLYISSAKSATAISVYLQ